MKKIKDESKIRIHIFVFGRVQGVFFRSETRKKAKNLGLRGWARNLANGCLEVVVEGEKNATEQMLEWLKKGPPLAKVERVEARIEEFQAEFNDFEIRR